MGSDSVTRNIKKWMSVVVCAALILFFWINPIWRIGLIAQDAALQRRSHPHPNVFVVGIDEWALAEFGAFGQWPRSIMAEAINILNSDEFLRPAVIAVDILYVEPGFDRAGDATLVAAAQSGGNVVMAAYIEVGFDREALDLDLRALNMLKPFDDLLPHVEIGLVNAQIDSDNVIRNALLWENFEGRRYLSFPAAIAAKYLGEIHPFITEHPSTYLRYSGIPGTPGDFFEMSFAEIFEPGFEPGWFAGSIILIGPYATGMMDHHPVPIYSGMTMHGVEIHANAVHAILDEAFFLHAPDWIAMAILVSLLIVGMMMGELLDIRVVLLVFLVMIAGYIFGVIWIFGQGWVLPVLYAPLGLVIIFAYHLIYGYVLNAIEKGRLRSTFKKYVDPKLVDALIASGDADSDEVGSKKHISILFVDVRGFTTMAETLASTPEKVVEILNEYLELTSSAVFDNGGSVDKFIGDATMALFNGFVPLDDYVYLSVKSAWDMVQGAQSVNESIKAQYGLEIGFGIGVHCGEAIVGNLGPSFRKDYTAIGDAVNTAARLESNASKSQVLISKDVYEALDGRIEAAYVGEISLKGKAVAMEVYSLTSVL